MLAGDVRPAAGLRRPIGISAVSRLVEKWRRRARTAREVVRGQADLIRLTERLAATQLRQAVASGHAGPWSDAGFRVFSQNEEDGLLIYVFALVGTTSKYLVDIGCRSALGSNSANLLLNHGWQGLLVDADRDAVAELRHFYRLHPDTWMLPPTVLYERVTPTNVNDLVRSGDPPDEIDLLSLDIDGIDYWVWDALDIVRPRVIVVEAQVIWDADRAVTVPNDRGFEPIYRDGFAIYSGASVAAFDRLAERKGYALVGTNRLGYNLFFVRRDILPATLRSIEPRDVTSLPFPRAARSRYLEEISHMPWVDV